MLSARLMLTTAPSRGLFRRTLRPPPCVDDAEGVVKARAHIRTHTRHNVGPDLFMLRRTVRDFTLPPPPPPSRWMGGEGAGFPTTPTPARASLAKALILNAPSP